MLITFHYLFLITQYLLRKMTQVEEKVEVDTPKKAFTVNQPCHALYDSCESMIFDPPVYKQRYAQVASILLDEKWRSNIKKIVDFGCAEYGLFMFIKRLISIQEILFVDIDYYLLEQNLFRLRPLTNDFINRRSQPLTVKVFAGSITDPDCNLENTDAVVAIEIIEHLYPDVLDCFPYNIFSYVHPKLIIFSTPNADFNVLFGKSKFPNGFRHEDHKFEWTRQQFEDWGRNLQTRFPEYSVDFVGIGSGPRGSESYGDCTQMAVFIRGDTSPQEHCSCPSKECLTHSTSNLCCICECNNCKPKYSYGVCTYQSCSKNVNFDPGSKTDNNFFKPVETIDYPFEIDNRSPSEKIMDEVRYKINSYNYLSSCYYNEECDRFEIPISLLIYNSYRDQMLTVRELRPMLLEHNYKLEVCEVGPLKDIEECVICDNEKERRDSCWYSSDDEEVSSSRSQSDNQSNYSDWDADENEHWDANANEHNPSSQSNSAGPNRTEPSSTNIVDKVWLA